MKLEKLDKILMWALCVTLVAEIVLNFIGSYGHIYVEGSHYGEHGVDDRILPITIDGMLLALAIGNVFAARFNRRSKWLRFGLILGVGGTVAANGAYGAAWGMTGGLLSVWAPVALFITVECGLFVFRIIADLAAEAKPAEAVSGPSTATPDAAMLQAVREYLMRADAAAVLDDDIPELAPVPEPSEAAEAAEQEGKAPAPANLNLSKWQELNGARN